MAVSYKYLDIVYQSGVTRPARRENWEKLEGEQELKPGKDVRKAEKDSDTAVKAVTSVRTQRCQNILEYMKKTHTCLKNSVAQYVSLSAGNFSMQRLTICYYATS